MRRRRFGMAGASVLTLAFFGCAGLQIVNVPLEQPADNSYGYRRTNTAKNRDEGKVLMSLAFSGGGTRAAAFAYGVMEELRDTEVTIDGETARAKCCTTRLTSAPSCWHCAGAYRSYSA